MFYTDAQVQDQQHSGSHSINTYREPVTPGINNVGRELGEIVEAVKMPPTRNGTKRPREPSLQLSAGVGRTVRRIGGRL